MIEITTEKKMIEITTEKKMIEITTEKMMMMITGNLAPARWYGDGHFYM